MFFIPFILIATFTMLNLFIAIIVNAMQTVTDADREATQASIEGREHIETDLHDEVRALRGEIAELKELLRQQPRLTLQARRQGAAAGQGSQMRCAARQQRGDIQPLGRGAVYPPVAIQPAGDEGIRHRGIARFEQQRPAASRPPLPSAGGRGTGCPRCRRRPPSVAGYAL